MNIFRSIGRAVTWPVRRLLSPRFDDTNRRLVDARLAVHAESEATRQQLAAHVSEMGAGLAQHMSAVVPQVSDAVDRMERVVDRYAADHGNDLAILGAELRSLSEDIRARSGNDPHYVDRVNRAAEGPVEELDGAVANLLNVAEGHRGFAAQRGLWLNPPLTLSYRAGDVSLGSVNERIVEPAYAFRAMADLGPAARILDVGSVESSVALTLASLGYGVTALDLRPYPFEHPRLTAVESRLEDWEPDAPFDAILCISTIEHVGLGWYGEARDAADADRRALKRLGTFLAPGGKLVLTVPYGSRSVDAVQRVYDGETLGALLAGWHVDDLTLVAQRDECTWERVDAAGENAVAMVVARPDPAR